MKLWLYLSSQLPSVCGAVRSCRAPGGNAGELSSGYEQHAGTDPAGQWVMLKVMLQVMLNNG